MEPIVKKFKCVYIKTPKVIGRPDPVVQLVEQEYITNQDGITVICPKGYTLFQIVEYLPAINQCKDEKVSN